MFWWCCPHAFWWCCPHALFHGLTGTPITESAVLLLCISDHDSEHPRLRTHAFSLRVPRRCRDHVTSRGNVVPPNKDPEPIIGFHPYEFILYLSFSKAPPLDTILRLSFDPLKHLTMVAWFQHTKPPEMLKPHKSHIAIQSIVRFYLTVSVPLLGQGQGFPGSWFKELKVHTDLQK